MIYELHRSPSNTRRGLQRDVFYLGWPIAPYGPIQTYFLVSQRIFLLC